MSVIERVRESIKYGDSQKIANEMGKSKQLVSGLIKKDEVESLRFLFAVSKVTGKSVNYFLEGHDDYASMVSEPLESYGKSDSALKKLLADKEREIAKLKSKISELQDKLIKCLEQ